MNFSQNIYQYVFGRGITKIIRLFLGLGKIRVLQSQSVLNEAFIYSFTRNIFHFNSCIEKEVENSDYGYVPEQFQFIYLHTKVT